MRRTYSVVVAVLAAAIGAEGQTVTAGPLELDLRGRVQMQMNTTSVDATGVPATIFRTRRVRFGTDLEYGGWVTGVVEADFGGSGAALTDGYVDLAFSDLVAVRGGQFKKPFGLIELTSSTKTLTIERSVLIRGLDDALGTAVGEEQWLLEEGGYLGRDIGFMAHGGLGPLAYSVGVFNGAGANTAEDDGSKAYAARLTFDAMPELTVGFGHSRQPTGQPDAAGDELVAGAWEFDAEWGSYRGTGLHVMAEGMYGDDPALISAGEAPTMMGGEVVVAWFVPRNGRFEGIEPVVRVSWGDPDADTDADEGLLVTPGLTVYLSGRNRIMLNGDFYMPAADGADSQYSVVAQMQIYF